MKSLHTVVYGMLVISMAVASVCWRLYDKLRHCDAQGSDVLGWMGKHPEEGCALLLLMALLMASIGVAIMFRGAKKPLLWSAGLICILLTGVPILLATQVSDPFAGC